ncbi:MAG: xanthine dehydrogenase family protein subunit M [Deltaproteobacteria bacterium]|nr:MAG: xanthine dehydrogenase family protein subunit M [Deltaproteobacteria bacterium]
MPLPKFEYMAPTTLAEACKLLKDNAPNARVMAGGTDLLIKAKHKAIRPGVVIGLKNIPDLDVIRVERNKGLTIGATALLADVAAHPQIKRFYPAIAYAASVTANVQIRNMGTVVGNLCNAAPSADNAPTLLAMEAEVIITGVDEQRTVPLKDFFTGPGLTVLEPGEIVKEIFVPWPPPRSGVSFQHISPRGKVDISAVCVGAMVIMDGKVCREARVALGAVAPIPMRAKKTERLLKGRELTNELLQQAGAQATKEAKPISDMRASARYRRQMVAVLTKRALEEAVKRARTRIKRG